MTKLLKQTLDVDLRKSRVLLNKIVAMVTSEIEGNQKYNYLMLDGLLLKVTKFQPPTLDYFSAVMKNIPTPCQIGLTGNYVNNNVTIGFAILVRLELTKW